MSSINFFEIFDSIPASIFAINKQGTIVFLNKSAQNFSGINAANLSAENLFHYLSNDGMSFKEIINDFPESQSIVSLEAKFTSKNKKTFYTTVAVNKLENKFFDEQVFIISITDLTFQKMQAELIKESQIRFENIANSAPVMIWITDVDGLIIFVNKIWSEFSGRSLGEELGFNWIKDVHPDDLAELMNLYQRSTSEHTNFSHQFRLKRKDNIYRWLMMNGIPRFNDDNMFLGFIGTCIDVTQQKEDEDYIREINIELQKANQNKDKFFSIISHDLRSPLSGIMSLLEIIVNEYDSLEESELKEIIFEAARTARITYTLMENLLDWSRIQTGRMVYDPYNLSIAEIVSGIENLYLQKFKEKNIAFKSELCDKCITYADSYMIETILRNLVSNAIKFTNTGGTISISSEQLENEMLIKVTDTGVGMSENQISNLFKLDQTSSTIGTAGERGTGLGLMLCKELVEKQGGRIWIESIFNSGTTFYFTLPKAK